MRLQRRTHALERLHIRGQGPRVRLLLATQAMLHISGSAAMAPGNPRTGPIRKWSRVGPGQFGHSLASVRVRAHVEEQCRSIPACAVRSSARKRRSHGIDVTGYQASFREGWRDQRRTPCQARAGMSPRIARKLAGFLGRCSHGIDVTGIQASFGKGSMYQRPTPCQARARVAPRIARKPVRFLSRCSHRIDVTGNQASFRKRSGD